MLRLHDRWTVRQTPDGVDAPPGPSLVTRYARRVLDHDICSEREATRTKAGQNPAWRGDFRQEKGPGDKSEPATTRPSNTAASVLGPASTGHCQRRPSKKIRKRGASKVVVRPDGQIDAPGKVATQHDQPLMAALTRAFYWQQLLDDGVVGSVREIAQREGLHQSTVNELLRLTLLEPAIIQAILAGQQPRCMSLLWFQRNPLPTDWVAQREVVAAFDV
jgi:hypothetical protein